MSEKINNSLLEQKSALGNYLNDMLHQATETAALVEVESASAIDKVLLPADLLLPVDNEEEGRVATVVEGPSEEKLHRAVHIDATTEPSEVVELLHDFSGFTTELFPIQCLMFKVGETLLSIPLTELHSVVEWKNKLTQLPGEPDWAIGVLKHRDNNIRVIDSASLLQIKREEERLPGFILVLGDENWGISCDQIDKVMTLNYDDVQWNQNQTNQMALGTIRNSLSSLLNPSGIINYLSNGQFSE